MTVPIYKMVLVGGNESGKSACLEQYINHRFSEEYSETIGMKFRMKKLGESQRKFARMLVWDTSGHPNNKIILLNYIDEQTNAVTIFCDLTNIQSLTHA